MMKTYRAGFLRWFVMVGLGLVLGTAQAKPPFGDGWKNHDESTGESWRKNDRSKDKDRHKPDKGYGWVKHDKSNTKMTKVLGMDDKQHTATCSGYPGVDAPAGSNAEFSFWSKKGKSDNVAVFFEGGGACWDATTCSFPISNTRPEEFPANLQFFSPAIDPASTPADYDGMFDTDNPANPIRDWSIVYIPYCTGDLHTGSTTKTYPNAGSPFINATSFDIQHRGFDNFMVVMNWMKKNIHKPTNVLVTGSSAGGYGAIANFPWIERAYRKANTYVIADASQGVTTPGFDLDGRSSWNMQLAPWAFGNNPMAIPGPELLRVAAKARPKVKTAQFSTAYDEVQISFYGYMAAVYGSGGYYGGGGSCADLPVSATTTVPGVAIDWNHQMVSSLLSYASDVPNFRYYLAEGSYHTLMRSSRFYTEGSAGIAFSQWVEDMLSNRGGRGGHGGGWYNVGSPPQLPCVPKS